MGWGQPVGKRGRHRSDENRAEFSSENLSEEMKGHFGKRPRDVSPLNGEQAIAIDVDASNENRLTTCSTSDECSSTKNVSASSPGSSKQLNGLEDDQEYSVKSVIENISNNEETNKNYEGLMNQLKIRTSAPRLGALLKNSRTNSKKGPKVLACKGRTANPRKLSVTKMSSSSKKSPQQQSSSDSASEIESAPDSGITLADDEECCEGEYDDFDDNDLEAKSSEESIEDVSSSMSIDIVPSVDDLLPKTILPPIRPSYFPNVPPYINFCLHSEQTETLPHEIQKHLKWRLSTITPVVVKKTLTNSGYRLLRKTVEWGGQWGRHMKAALFKNSLKDFQKINHLPGTFQIGRKDRLWRNIQRYITKFGKEEFGFIPRTYVLPLEMKQLKSAWDSADAKGHLWIVKPPAGARGTGIRVVNKWNQVPKKKSVIVQSYISNPYLINDRKFDLRLYVLVTSFHPLKVYIYKEGLVRFAPVKYSHDSKRAGDRFMHLTNYSINKNCELYTQNEDAAGCEGHKWTLSTLWRHFESEGKNVEQLWEKIEEIVIKTLICAEDPIVTATNQCLPNRYNGYELFGFDVILDKDLKPWLLEVNISPSLHSSSPLDLAVKGPMVKELFNIVGFHLPPKLSPMLKTMLMNSLDTKLELETPVFDKRLYTISLSKEEQTKHKAFKMKYEKREDYLEDIIETLTPDDIRQLIIAEDEFSQCGDFIRIFPTPSSHSYAPYFEFPRYYNILFDAWENKYHEDRISAVNRLILLCQQKVHLQVPVHAGSMISESPVSSSSELGSCTDSWETVEENTDESRPVSTSDDKEMEPEVSQISLPTPEVELISTSTHSLPIKAVEIESKSVTTSASSPIAAVLDNITNNSSRTTLGSSCQYDDDRYSNGKTPNNPSSIPNKVTTDFAKRMCF